MKFCRFLVGPSRSALGKDSGKTRLKVGETRLKSVGTRAVIVAEYRPKPVLDQYWNRTGTDWPLTGDLLEADWLSTGNPLEPGWAFEQLEGIDRSPLRRPS